MSAAVKRLTDDQELRVLQARALLLSAAEDDRSALAEEVGAITLDDLYPAAFGAARVIIRDLLAVIEQLTA